MGWFKRYRHSKGFGIHSPFAFRLITEVIGETLPYYDYDVIRGGKDRLLYRLACRFQPQRVCVCGADASAVFMACPRAVPAVADACDMLVAGGDADFEAVRTAVRGQHTLVVLMGASVKRMRREVLDVLGEAGSGMTFDNGSDMMIIVPSPKLPRQDFSVKF